MKKLLIGLGLAVTVPATAHAGIQVGAHAELGMPIGDGTSRNVPPLQLGCELVSAANSPWSVDAPDVGLHVADIVWACKFTSADHGGRRHLGIGSSVLRVASWADD